MLFPATTRDLSRLMARFKLIQILICFLLIKNCLAISSSSSSSSDKQQLVSDGANKVDLIAVATRQTNGQQQSAKDVNAIQAELNSLINQQHEDGSLATDGPNQRRIAESIISRLMLDNLTNGYGSQQAQDEDILSTSSAGQDLMDDIRISIPMANGGDNSDYLQSYGSASDEADQSYLRSSNQQQQQQQQQQQIDPITFKKFWNKIQQYYDSALNNNNNRRYGELPSFQGSSSEVATMKRATAKINNYLQQNRQAMRNNYDFGLGKRLPEDAGSMGFLRFGDSSSISSNGGSSSRGTYLGQPVGQLGKRPSPHRYDFGLGKRLASPSMPRYDFGLGKRAPNRIRYDFGLGK